MEKEDLRRVDIDRFGKPVNHGTMTGYKNHGCRCQRCVDECRRYHRELNRTLNGAKPHVEYSVYGPLLEKHLDRGVIPLRIAQASGISPSAIEKMIRNRNPILHRSYEKLKAMPDTLPNGRLTAENRRDLIIIAPRHRKRNTQWADTTQAMRERRRRFESIFKYFWNGGFTKDTLAERLGIDEIGLRRFIESDYEDTRLAMRICQLHHVMRQGE